MASSSASGSELAELKEKLKGLEAQKTAELQKKQEDRDRELLSELNKDLDRVQAAITALSSGELQFTVSSSATQSSWYSLAIWQGHLAGLQHTSVEI